MERLKTYTFILSLTMFASCGIEQIDKNQPQKQETPKALQDEILEVKSYSRSSNDLTEELYLELVEKSAIRACFKKHHHITRLPFCIKNFSNASTNRKISK